MPPKQTNTLEKSSYFYVHETSLPRWTRTLSSDAASTQQNRDQRASTAGYTVNALQPTVLEVEDWECISDQSGDEDNGTPEARKHLIEIAIRKREARDAKGQTQRKKQQSEINRIMAEKQKERETKRAELRTWRQTGVGSPALEKNQGWLSWVSNYFQTTD